MIFSISKCMYERVLVGDKTLTTRLRLPAHIREGWEPAIVPKRGLAAWWLGADVIQSLTDWAAPRYPALTGRMRDAGCNYLDEYVRHLGYVRARIRVLHFWQTPLQAMTDAEAEQDCGRPGATVQDYAALWDSINLRKADQWEANPLVWRIRFHVTDAVTEAVRRIGRAAILAAAEQQRKELA